MKTIINQLALIAVTSGMFADSLAMFSVEAVSK